MSETNETTPEVDAPRTESGYYARPEVDQAPQIIPLVDVPELRDSAAPVPRDAEGRWLDTDGTPVEFEVPEPQNGVAWTYHQLEQMRTGAFVLPEQPEVRTARTRVRELAGVTGDNVTADGVAHFVVLLRDQLEQCACGAGWPCPHAVPLEVTRSGQAVLSVDDAARGLNLDPNVLGRLLEQERARRIAAGELDPYAPQVIDAALQDGRRYDG